MKCVMKVIPARVNLNASETVYLQTSDLIKSYRCFLLFFDFD